MPGFPFEPFPSRPFFSCEASQFRIVDQARMADLMRGQAEPWLTLEVGANNVFEARPMKVVGHSGLKVEIQTADAMIKLDLESESARKKLSDGSEFVYCGGLDEANSGLGWMPVS